MKPVSQENLARIHDAQLLAESDLSATHSISSLARSAGMSPFHFQRLFKRVTGETPGRQLRRLRVERAAFLMKRSDAHISQIAQACGFKTHSGFDRAFTDLFGLSPTEFRERQGVDPYLRLDSSNLHDSPVNPDQRRLARCPLTVCIEHCPAWTVAVRRIVGPTHKTPTVWPEFVRQITDGGLLKGDPVFLGIHSDDWDIPNVNRYRYDAGLRVDAEDVAPGVSTLSIPAGPVAMTSFSGSLLKLDKTWGCFVNEWLPASGWQFRTTFAFDLYPAELILSRRLRQIVRLLTGIQATLCIPVEAASAQPEHPTERAASGQ